MTTGTSITFNSGNFANNALLTLPNTPSPNLWVYIGGSLAQSQDVYNTGPILNGNGGSGPVFSTGYASFNGSGTVNQVLDTQLADANQNITIVSVFRGLASSTSNNINLGIISPIAIKGNNSFGIRTKYFSNATNSIWSPTWNGWAGPTQPTITMNTNLYNWKMLAFTLDQTNGFANVYSLTDNTSNSVSFIPSAANTRIIANTGTYTIGYEFNNGGGNVPAQADIAFLEIQAKGNVATLSQLQSLRNFLLQVLPNNGVSGF